MKTKKLLFITLTLLCFSFVANAQRGVRIGYIDMENILENVPEYKEASTQLNGKVQRWKKDLEKKNDEIELLKINLSTERVLLTTELIEEREEDIKVLEDEMIKYQQDRFGPNGDLFLQRQQLVQPIQDQVFNIVQEIAENKKYDFVFTKLFKELLLLSIEELSFFEITKPFFDKFIASLKSKDHSILPHLLYASSSKAGVPGVPTDLPPTTASKNFNGLPSIS